MRGFDIAVIGGGPAGAVAAREAARGGARVVLIERRRRIVGPAACTGLISPATLEMLGASEASVVRRIHGLRFHPPAGSPAVARAAAVKALVVDRTALERELLERARSEDVDVRLGTVAVSMISEGVHLRSFAGTSCVRAKIVIGADGPDSRVARWAGLPDTPPSFPASQAVLEGSTTDPAVAEVYLGREVAPGFFAWAVSAEERRLRIGLAVLPPASPKPFLERLIASRFPRHRIVSVTNARIPAMPVSRAVCGSTALVGDAAGHIKPLSGGGLYYGGLGARIAGRTAARAVRRSELLTEILAEYPDAWQRAAGAEIAFGLTAREILTALPDKGLDEVVAAFNRPEIAAAVLERADIDHLSRLISELPIHRLPWRSCMNALAIAHRYVDTEAVFRIEPIASRLSGLL